MKNVNMNTVDDVQKQLDELKARHREVDEMILNINESMTGDQLEIQRLKKQKLLIKRSFMDMKCYWLKQDYHFRFGLVFCLMTILLMAKFYQY